MQIEFMIICKELTSFVLAFSNAVNRINYTKVDEGFDNGRIERSTNAIYE